MTFEIRNPFDQSIIDTVKLFNKDDIERAVNSGKKAFLAWSHLPLRVRSEKLATFSRLLAENAQKCAELLSREMGKPVHQAKGEVLASLPRVEWFLKNSPGLLDSVTMASVGSMEEKISWEPLGCIGNISAWNFPYFVGLNVIVPALLTGNTILYKPSEYTTLTGIQIGDLLYQAGIPDDVFQVITGTGSTGKFLSEAELDGMFFTGSVNTGKRISAAISDKMMNSGFELGGKDPAYICEDADLDSVIPNVVDGALYNAGQSCCSVERIYIHESVYDEAIERIQKQVKDLIVGDPGNPDVYMGPLARKEQIEFLNEQIQDALDKGAKLLVKGGVTGEHEQLFKPVFLTETNHQMKIMKEESFGPVAGIMKVESDDQAVALMNDSDYGLTASVHSKSKSRAQSVMSRLEAGTVYWNCCDRVSANLPWSGRKRSGLGSTLSEPGLRAFVQPKSWHLNHPSESPV